MATGFVLIVIFIIQYKMRFLVARCQGSVSPAKLEVFISDGHSRSTMSKLQELSFKGLKDVSIANEGSSEGAKKLITLQTQEGDGLKFYSKSEVEHNTWYIYCYVLSNIPTYPIPDVYHHHIPLDSFKQEVEPKRFSAGKRIILSKSYMRYVCLMDPMCS